MFSAHPQSTPAAGIFRAVARFRRGIRGCRRQLPDGRRTPLPRGLERVRARAQRGARRRDSHVGRPHRAGLHPRAHVVVASALRRLRRLRRARRRPAPARARVSQHGPAHGDALSRRRGGLPDDFARGQRRRVRAPRRGRRRRLAAAVRDVHGLGRAQLRRALGQALESLQGLGLARRPTPASGDAACSRSPAARW